MISAGDWAHQMILNGLDASLFNLSKIDYYINSPLKMLFQTYDCVASCGMYGRPITLKWKIGGLSVSIEIAFSCSYTKFEPFSYC